MQRTFLCILLACLPACSVQSGGDARYTLVSPACPEIAPRLGRPALAVQLTTAGGDLAVAYPDLSRLLLGQAGLEVQYGQLPCGELTTVLGSDGDGSSVVLETFASDRRVVRVEIEPEPIAEPTESAPASDEVPSDEHPSDTPPTDMPPQDPCGTAELLVSICPDGGDDDVDICVCDDGQAPRAFFLDADADGFGDPATETVACETPDRYVTTGGDCDDSDDTVRPSAAELCNDVDDDCDGAVDDAAIDQLEFYLDEDGDGFGDPARPTQACELPAGHTVNDDDCDDTNAAVNPLAPEVVNGIDDNCDGIAN